MRVSLTAGRYRHLADQFGDDVAIPTPDVPEWLAWCWRAWHTLHVGRPWRGGEWGPIVPGAISWAAVREWCEFHDKSGSAVAFLFSVVQAMDAEYAQWHAEQRQKQTSRRKKRR